ncbi:isoprenylcysteine carboxylmethyltransferase family protein [Rhodopila globiformis]|uniref:Uncharacterized protein n=1 Tax=Rhodopila globiformis TaxID=1071 RepID=A0A2S6NLJ5_RHOGL|nr:isoprenylcysteine carboxylmethyltransferase family protein [Rhodopila globiformis]PPQ36244.1 hypothetical protein CCS01_05500 [Rhodopila globiformis]
MAFYAILCALLLLRAPPKAQAEGLAPRVAAFVGTYLPWTMGILAKPTGSAALNLASTGFVLVGMTLTMITVVQLGRAFSLVPQARRVVRSGPYRWLRHRLYFFEEISVFGAMLQAPGGCCRSSGEGSRSRTGDGTRSSGIAAPLPP